MCISSLTLHAQGVRTTSSDKVEDLLKSNPETVILDVRTPGEFSQGHLAGALNIDARQADVYSRIGKLDKSKTYLVYCRTRNRSGLISSYMANNNFKNVIQMTDGMMGWEANSLPLQNETNK